MLQYGMYLVNAPYGGILMNYWFNIVPRHLFGLFPLALEDGYLPSWDSSWDSS